jgi:hypothetical protein
MINFWEYNPVCLLLSNSYFCLHQVNFMKTFLMLSAFLFLSACSTYMHVLEVKSEEGLFSNDVYIFENDSMSVSYSFWDEKGIIAFRIENKTNIPLYIDWKKSSLISGGSNNSYWEDTELRSSKSSSRSNGAALYYDDVRFERGSSTTTSSTKILRPSRINSIAPNSGILKAEFLITPEYQLSLYNHRSEEFPSIKKRGATTTIHVSEFESSNSPISFRNFLVFSFSEDFQNEIYVQHSFFVSKITEIELEEAVIVLKDADPPMQINRFKSHSSFFNLIKGPQSVKTH